MPRLAIFFHLGNHLMFPLLQSYIDLIYSLDYPTDLYVAYQFKSQVLDLIQNLYPNVIFIESLLGCDIGGQLLMMDNAIRNKKSYDYVFKLHSKNNPNWRHDLLEPICGNAESIRKVISLFEENPHIGMIGSSRYMFKIDETNGHLQKDLCEHLSLVIDPSSQYYIAGTIFWIRWKTIVNVVKRNHISLQEEYSKLEPGYLKNDRPTFTHSWERIFGIMIYNEHQEILGITSSNDYKYNFDVKFYREYYEDLRMMSDRVAMVHWNEYGQKEGRLCNQFQLEEIFTTDPHAMFREKTNSDKTVAILIAFPFDSGVIQLIKLFIQEKYDVDLYVGINMMTTLRRRAIMEAIEQKQCPHIFDDFKIGDIIPQLVEYDIPFLKINFYRGFLVSQSYRYVIATSVDTALGLSQSASPSPKVYYLPSLSDDIDVLTLGLLGNPPLIVVPSSSSQIKLSKCYNNVLCVPAISDIFIYKPLSIDRENAICVLSDDIEPLLPWLLIELPSNLTIYVMGKIPMNSPPNIMSIQSLSPNQYNELYNKCQLGLSMSVDYLHQQTIDMIASGLPVIEHINCHVIPDDMVTKIILRSETMIKTINEMLHSPQKLESMRHQGISYMNERAFTSVNRSYDVIKSL